MNSDILLINPPGIYYETSDEHLGLGYIASYARSHGINVSILDIPLNGWPSQTAVKEINKHAYKLIGISIPFQDYASQVLDFIKALRNEGITCHFTVGGIFPTFKYEEILTQFPEIDTIILGEGEITFTELAQKLLNDREWRDTLGIAYREKNAVTKTPLRPLNVNLDDLPFPARDTLPLALKKQPAVSMLASRGCYGGCSFCSVVPFFSSFGPKCRVRSAANVIEEIEILYNKHGMRNIIFNDAEFAGGIAANKKIALEIAEELIKRNLHINFSIQCRVNDIDIEIFRILRQAGLRRVFLGVESGSQTMLNRFKKGVSVQDNLNAIEILGKLDMYVSMGFIMFDEKTTFTEVSENMDFLKTAKSLMPKGKLQNVFIATKVLPLAGTEFERNLMQAGKYQGDYLNYNYSLDDPSMDLLFRIMSGFSKTAQRTTRLLRIKDTWETQWTRKDEK